MPSNPKSKAKSKREKCYTKPQLPFTRDFSDEEPIPPLSPILCNHYFPQLELVSANHHGLYWVSPQCHNCETKPRRRKRRNFSTNPKPHSCGQSQYSSTRTMQQQKELVVSVPLPTAKEKFLNSRKPCEKHDHSIVAPETPINEQGLTLREKLIRKSRRLQTSTGAMVKES